ncbi:uncharacterized protein CXorf65 homolog [Lineus longissimus]|uniref:uncharacterized protein CXorf65 homolog n=1 Tax=Lineus longissimus TaxID=88925 RepID=UPI00315CA61A
MFITLRFGDDDKLLVNPNCACKNILEFIREKCDCDKSALVDLCDENGCVKYLHEQPEMDLASDIIQDKATYIPLVVEKNEDQTIKKFHPLLQNCKAVYPTLKSKPCHSYRSSRSHILT